MELIFASEHSLQIHSLLITLLTWRRKVLLQALLLTSQVVCQCYFWPLNGCWRSAMNLWEEFSTHVHYYILCLFAKGQTKNLKGLRRKNKKPEGFAKQKKSAKFVMRYASQLVVHHSSQIDNEPLIIASFLRDTRQTKLCDLLNLCPP